MKIIKGEIMNEEYKEMIRENFLKFIKKEEIENNSKIIVAMYFAWLEATRQADERNKCLNSVYHMANNNTKSIREE